MNRKLKQKLQQAYRMPKPSEKEHFLQQLNYPKTTLMQFLFGQTGYIKIRTWILSVVLLGLMLYITNNVLIVNRFSADWIEVIKVTSALVPFLAMNAVTELIRSRQYGMVEMEMATKYSYSKVLLARMLVLGISNLIILFIVLPFISQKTGLGIIRVGVYIIIPYLSTVLMTTWLINRVKSREINFYCIVSSISVSCAIMLMGSLKHAIYMGQYFMIWSIVFVVLLILSIHEGCKMIKNTEEYTWNSQLTA